MTVKVEKSSAKDSSELLGRLLDYFIPNEMQVNNASHRRARMFMLSHLFGPVLGSSLPAYLFVMDISRDYHVGIFSALILTFWLYPFLLRWTGRYQLLSFVSIQNLILCVFWACFSYGGLHSPFLPWMLIFPLLAFLYLPTDGHVRNLLLVQIFGNSLLFLGFLKSGIELPPIELESLEVIGMISMASVAIYFAMMSTYFARIFQEQEEFARETASIISTAENVQQLTAAARQAGIAKANFVASMSHELRTPLNSIIGYSQLLVEEAIDEEDGQSLSDLQKINLAGTHLLRLIDDILDYSRVDAGKMPVNPTCNHGSALASLWTNTIESRLSDLPVTVNVNLHGGQHLTTDWVIAGNIVRLIAMAMISAKPEGTLEIVSAPVADGLLIDTVLVDKQGGALKPVLPTDSFEHGGDATATKYGGVGIETTLAQRFAILLGGSVSIAKDQAGRPCFRLHLVDLAVAKPSAIAA